MNPIEKIDAFIINKIYQPVVEWLQVKVVTLIEQCGYAMLVVSLLTAADMFTNGKLDNWWPALFVILSFVYAGLIIRLAKQIHINPAFKSLVWRILWILFFVSKIVSILLLGIQVDLLLRAMDSFLIMTVYYLAVCRDPTPRFKTKTSLSMT